MRKDKIRWAKKRKEKKRKEKKRKPTTNPCRMYRFLNSLSRAFFLFLSLLSIYYCHFACLSQSRLNTPCLTLFITLPFSSFFVSESNISTHLLIEIISILYLWYIWQRCWSWVAHYLAKWRYPLVLPVTDHY